MLCSPAVLHCHGSYTFPWPEMSALPCLTTWNRTEVQGEGLNVTISDFLALYSTRTFLFGFPVASCISKTWTNTPGEPHLLSALGKGSCVWHQTSALAIAQRDPDGLVLLPSKSGKELSTKPFPWPPQLREKALGGRAEDWEPLHTSAAGGCYSRWVQHGPCHREVALAQPSAAFFQQPSRGKRFGVLLFCS